ncbi:uncharacterized protein DFL_003438 [Arthrobotrys flagrans]|uniref:Uncharacterized protein n=1 Tax=Arthrobotrys flagrans TaxID=97331 RepID=A0A437A1V7_ARTFL|nr:hypothetical protein DFL_003438 [Arthrobotrys flagrans]
MSSPPGPAPTGGGSPIQKRPQAVPIIDTVTTPKKRGVVSTLPSTPSAKGNSPTRLQTTPTRGLGSPKPQFTSKSSIPGRWLPSYPEDPVSQPVSQPTPQPVSLAGGNKIGKSTLTEKFHSIKNQNNLPSAMHETSLQANKDTGRTASPKLSSSSSSGSTSSRERTPPFTIYEEAVPKPPGAPKSPALPQSEPTIQAPTATSKKAPAILEASQGYGPNNHLQSQDLLWGMKKEKRKSSQTLRRLLSEAQDRERVDDQLVKMSVIPPTVPIIGVSGKSPGQYSFPSFPVQEGPKTKPFAPDDLLLQSMAEIPTFLERFKPKEVRALFGNYVGKLFLLLPYVEMR